MQMDPLSTVVLVVMSAAAITSLIVVFRKKEDDNGIEHRQYKKLLTPEYPPDRMSDLTPDEMHEDFVKKALKNASKKGVLPEPPPLLRVAAPSKKITYRKFFEQADGVLRVFGGSKVK